MSKERSRAEWIAEDRATLWHPFTQHDEWLGYEPLVVESAEGFFLVDVEGRRYLDGVSSIWCNVHGHGHPRIVDAIVRQAERLAHSTMLGLSHVPAIELARRSAWRSSTGGRSDGPSAPAS
jgi:adenosylmethionine-8-amino-7-oxononanoate aminotransferase